MRDKQNEIGAEEHRNRRYLQAAERKIRSATQRAPRGIYSRQTRVSRRNGLDTRDTYPFLGRVQLRESWDELDGRSDFYIGSRAVELDGFSVVSWQAPVAKLFFTTGATGEVQATRTFELAGDQVVDFEDDAYVPGTRFPLAARPTLAGPPGGPRRSPAPPPAKAMPPMARRPTDSGSRTSLDDTEPQPAQPRATVQRPRKQPALRPSRLPPQPVPHPRPTEMPPRPPRSDRTHETTSSDRRSAAQEAKAPSASAAAVSQAPATPTDTTEPVQGPPPPGFERPSPPKPDLRAEQLLRKRLQATRREGLRNTLATVQGDQYRLIVRPRRSNMIVHGSPGTGKTLIAAYRLAYLLGDGSDETVMDTNRPLKKVLFLGPSRAYSDKISQLAGELGADPEYDVVPAAEFLASLRAGLPEVVGGTRPKADDAHPDMVPVVELAARLVRSANRGDWNSDPRRAIYQHLHIARTGMSKRAAGWLKKRPAYGVSVGLKKYQYLHEYIGAVALREFTSPSTQPAYDHVVVDEAQDLNALQWQALVRACPFATWTVLGDTAQRRDHLGLTRWTELAQFIGQATSMPCPVEEIAVGYRSTKQILEFAGRLLPSSERKAYSVQSGAPPAVTRVPAKAFDRMLTGHMMQLCQRHTGGSVAVIAYSDRPLRAALQQHGWRYQDRNRWTRGLQEVTVLTGQEARGLEFDAVIVIEPTLFLDKSEPGQLYSALTRANRELVVLHTERLPRQLRAAERELARS